MKERIPLKKGSKLKAEGTEIIVGDVIGMGGSCIVYDAGYTDRLSSRHGIRLKELYPENADCIRSENGELIFPEPPSPVILRAKKRFESAVAMQSQLRVNLELTNNIFHAGSCFAANGTEYTVMDSLNGECLSRMTFSSIHDYLEILAKAVKTISMYHTLGYLHLDIKPDNIYCVKLMNESKIMLFDFDSVVKAADVQSGTAVLSCSDNYAAPELRNAQRDRIGCQTDFFSIGVMLFHTVFERFPSAGDMRRSAKWNKSSNPLMTGTSNIFFKELCVFFNKTIAASVSDRFSDNSKLISSLERLVELSDVKYPFIESRFCVPFPFFAGRESELSAMYDAFGDSDCVVISGMGGVGKSMLAVNFAKKHREEYDAVIFAQYTSSFDDLFLDDNVFSLANFGREDEESDQSYLKRKEAIFNELCSEAVLLIIDNFDKYERTELEKILSLPCRKIITTRSIISEDEVFSVELRGLPECEQLFSHYCGRQLTDKERNSLREILAYIDYHTLTAELLAKLLNHTDAALEDILKKLKEYEIESIDTENIKSGKDRKLSNQPIQRHIDVLFMLSDFSGAEVYVLRNLAALSAEGVNTELFREWCGIGGEASLRVLAERGMIRLDSESGVLSMHPLIADRVGHFFPPEAHECEQLIISLIKYASDVPYSTYNSSGYFMHRHRVSVCERIIPRIEGESGKLGILLANYLILRLRIFSPNNKLYMMMNRADEMIKKYGEGEPVLFPLVKLYLEINKTRSSLDDDISPQMIELKKYAADYRIRIPEFTFSEKIILGCFCRSIAYEIQYNFNDDDEKEAWKYAEEFWTEAYNSAEAQEEKKIAAGLLYDIYFSPTNPLQSAQKANKYERAADRHLKIIYPDGSSPEYDYYSAAADELDAMRQDGTLLIRQLKKADEVMAHWHSAGDTMDNYLSFLLISVYREAHRIEEEFELMLAENNGYN